jgi:hypothetical protein
MTEWDKVYLKRDKMPEPTKLPDLDEKMEFNLILALSVGATSALALLAYVCIKFGLI